MVEFGVLGPLLVCDGGREVHIAGARQRKVLALLLLESNLIVPLDRLVTALWDDTPPMYASKSVRNAVSALRTDLAAVGAGELIVATDAGYGLRPAAASLDSQVFASHLDRGRALAAADEHERAAKEYRSALDLWRGRPLAGITGRVIDAAATRLAEQRLTAYEEWVDLELALRRHRELVADLGAVVAEHPFRESLVSRLMIALSRSGRQAKALEIFRRTRTRLVTELGVEPGPQLRGTHEAVLRGDHADVPDEMPVSVVTGRGGWCVPRPHPDG